MNKQERTRRARINTNRLFRLADLLRDLKPSEFNMEAWIEALKGVHRPVFSTSKYFSVKKPSPDCGTVCCIGGWATAVHPDLVIQNGNLKNIKTGGVGERAFALAFGISFVDANELTRWDAPHQTNIKAADAVEKLANDLAERNGLEVVEV